jgi:hypothetical protein
MKETKCPKCKKKIDMLTEICPHCGEMIFFDVIESKEIHIETDNKIKKFKDNIKENIDNVKREKLIKRFGTKVKKGANNIVSWNKKKIAIVHDKIRKTKIYPYITYQNVLCVATVIATIAMVGMGIKIAKFTDNTSTVSKVNNKTTYQQVEHLQKEEKVEKRLDLQRGLIIMIYKDQEFAGIKSTVIYEVIPKTDKINQTIIKFPYKKKNVEKMKKYLEVNYGYAKKKKDDTLVFVDDEYRYTFTNGTSIEEDGNKEEIVEIIPLKNE